MIVIYWVEVIHDEFHPRTHVDTERHYSNHDDDHSNRDDNQNVNIYFWMIIITWIMIVVFITHMGGSTSNIASTIALCIFIISTSYILGMISCLLENGFYMVLILLSNASVVWMATMLSYVVPKFNRASTYVIVVVWMIAACLGLGYITSTHHASTYFIIILIWFTFVLLVDIYSILKGTNTFIIDLSRSTKRDEPFYHGGNIAMAVMKFYVDLLCIFGGLI